jgi:hypothetical protein
VNKGFPLAVILAAFVSMAAAPPAAVTLALPAHTPDLKDAVPDKNGINRMAILRGLDKITGRAIDVAAPVGVAVQFGSLAITVRYCYTVPPEEPPETSAFLQIDDGKPGKPKKRVFSGWMFASTPALNALEHPVYDVWVITCKTDQPVAPPPAAPPVLASPAVPASASPAPPAGAAAAPVSRGLPNK